MKSHFHPELKDARYVVFFDSCRQYVDCSEGVSHFLGYDRASILKKSIDDVSYSPDCLPDLFKAYMQRGKQKGEYILRHTSGEPLPIRYRAFAFSDGCRAARWEVITDWRSCYLAAVSEKDAGRLGRRIDVALAAIYQRLYGSRAGVSGPDTDHCAVFEALAKLGSLRKGVPSALSPQFLGYEKTRSALFRLADEKRNSEALRVLLEENRYLIESSMRQWLPIETRDKMLPSLLQRVANRARYYDPGEDPIIWLQDCAKLECQRLKNELGNGPRNEGI